MVGMTLSSIFFLSTFCFFPWTTYQGFWRSAFRFYTFQNKTGITHKDYIKNNRVEDDNAGLHSKSTQSSLETDTTDFSKIIIIKPTKNILITRNLDGTKNGVPNNAIEDDEVAETANSVTTYKAALDALLKAAIVDINIVKANLKAAMDNKNAAFLESLIKINTAGAKEAFNNYLIADNLFIDKFSESRQVLDRYRRAFYAYNDSDSYLKFLENSIGYSKTAKTAGFVKDVIASPKTSISSLKKKLSTVPVTKSTAITTTL